jgi:hypothetical protein
MAIELLPKNIATSREFVAAAGEDGWVTEKNAEPFLLKKYKRPATSFPWYTLTIPYISMIELVDGQIVVG